MRPIVINHQQKNGAKSYGQFKQLVKKISKYHSEPIGFMVSQLLAFAMRFNRSSSFYRNLQEARSKFGIASRRSRQPYVAIQIRRSDKWDEAEFVPCERYMEHVERFYHYFFQKNPAEPKNMQRTVYVASDDRSVITSLKEK